MPGGLDFASRAPHGIQVTARRRISLKRPAAMISEDAPPADIELVQPTADGAVAGAPAGDRVLDPAAPPGRVVARPRQVSAAVYADRLARARLPSDVPQGQLGCSTCRRGPVGCTACRRCLGLAKQTDGSWQWQIIRRPAASTDTALVT